MNTILLFGGAFDPVHYGHISLLNSAIKIVHPTKVIIMPSGLPAHKSAHTAPKYARLKMCRAFLPFFSNIEIDSYEVDKNDSSYTINTLTYLKNKYKDAKITISIGSDMLLMFHKWKDYKQILKHAALVVHCRDENHIEKVADYAKNLKKDGADILLSNDEILQISSSLIRDCIKKGEDISEFVPPLVNKIITDNDLYL